jgi:tRNA G18 (ribose-2'-O)-methylase SpoU
MGSIFRTPLVGFDEAEGRRVGLVPEGGRPLGEIDFEGQLVLVLGAERAGLPAHVLARCVESATIPLSGGAESLNVATAGAIALYEARRA